MLQVSGITQQQFGKFKYLGGIQEWRNAEQGDCPNPQLCHLHHCLSQFFNRLAILDLGAGVEQSFHCLIVQNCQAVQSMRRSWVGHWTTW